jgi:hypothetical protein
MHETKPKVQLLRDHPKSLSIMKGLISYLNLRVSTNKSASIGNEDNQEEVAKLWLTELGDVPIPQLRHVARIASLSRSSARFGQPLTLDEMQSAWWKMRAGMSFQISSGQWEWQHSPYTQPSTPNE